MNGASKSIQALRTLVGKISREELLSGSERIVFTTTSVLIRVKSARHSAELETVNTGEGYLVVFFMTFSVLRSKKLWRSEAER